jgi:hypothetical protein
VRQRRTRLLWRSVMFNRMGGALELPAEEPHEDCRCDADAVYQPTPAVSARTQFDGRSVRGAFGGVGPGALVPSEFVNGSRALPRDQGLECALAAHITGQAGVMLRRGGAGAYPLSKCETRGAGVSRYLESSGKYRARSGGSPANARIASRDVHQLNVTISLRASSMSRTATTAPRLPGVRRYSAKPVSRT